MFLSFSPFNQNSAIRKEKKRKEKGEKKKAERKEWKEKKKKKRNRKKPSVRNKVELGGNNTKIRTG